MIVYRITYSKYATDISGIGAATHGGRWNKKGSAVLYTGESKEIALLELIAHIPPMLVPHLDILEISLPDDSVSELGVGRLPPNWGKLSSAYHFIGTCGSMDKRIKNNCAESSRLYHTKCSQLHIKLPSPGLHKKGEDCST